MRNAARILGIIGGLLGLVGALVVLFTGGLAGAFGFLGAGVVIGLAWLALILSILGIIGGALAVSSPTLGGIFMLVAAFGGFFSIFPFFVPGGLLLLVGGILALVAR